MRVSSIRRGKARGHAIFARVPALVFANESRGPKTGGMVSAYRDAWTRSRMQEASAGNFAATARSEGGGGSTARGTASSSQYRCAPFIRSTMRCRTRCRAASRTRSRYATRDRARAAHTLRRSRCKRISFCAAQSFSIDLLTGLRHDAKKIRTRHERRDIRAGEQPKGGVLIWDFLQRYDESWIWRCADRRQVTESARNFAALEECVDDAIRHGYVPTAARARRRAAQASSRRTRQSET